MLFWVTVLTLFCIRYSNFFDAIQFVLLGPKFSSLRQEDRQHLLHEGYINLTALDAFYFLWYLPNFVLRVLEPAVV